MPLDQPARKGRLAYRDRPASMALLEQLDRREKPDQQGLVDYLATLVPLDLLGLRAKLDLLGLRVPLV